MQRRKKKNKSKNKNKVNIIRTNLRIQLWTSYIRNYNISVDSSSSSKENEEIVDYYVSIVPTPVIYSFEDTNERNTGQNTFLTENDKTSVIDGNDWQYVNDAFFNWDKNEVDRNNSITNNNSSLFNNPLYPTIDFQNQRNIKKKEISSLPQEQHKPIIVSSINSSSRYGTRTKSDISKFI